KAELQSLTATWETCAVAEACRDVAEEEREGWLADRLAQMNAKQETIARDLERYQTLQSQLEAVRQTWQHRQTEHMQTVNAVKDVERTIQMDNERRAHAQSEHAAGNAHLEDTLVSLQSFFPDDL